MVYVYNIKLKQTTKTRDMKNTYFYGQLLKYSIEDFAALVGDKFGWSVKEQARDILNGQSYDDQNKNALRYIAEFAKVKGEKELSDSINEYLKP